MQTEFIDVYLPYCLMRQADGRYAVLNRRYKPVGLAIADHVDYASHPCLVNLPGLDAALAQRASASGSPDLARVYLYGDGTHPALEAAAWTAYALRLQVLCRLVCAP